MEENNNKPIGPKQKFYMNAGRSALLKKKNHMMEVPDRPFGGPSFTGKLSAYERSLEVAKNLHMGYTDRKIGPGRPTPAR